MYKEFLNETNPVLTITVKDFGIIKVELFPKIAPNTVANFVNLASKNYFANSTFHRVIKGFMIQGGQGLIPANPIKGEFTSNGFDNPLKHTKGVISMARTMDKNSATSQFFLMHEVSPHLDGEYAGFGIAVEGLDVIDRIASEKTDRYDAPSSPVIIESITVDTKGIDYNNVKYV